MKDYSLKFFSRGVLLSQKEELFINAYTNEPLLNRNFKLEALGLLTYLQMQLFSDGETGFYYDISGERKKFLAFKLGLLEEQLTKILDWCFIYEILDKELYDKYKILTSYKMQDDYSKIIERRSQNINMDYVYQADFTNKYETALQKYKIALQKKENVVQNQKIALQNEQIVTQNSKIALQNEEIALQNEEIAVQNSTDKIREDKNRLDNIILDERRKEQNMNEQIYNQNQNGVSRISLSQFKSLFPNKKTSKEIIVPLNVNLELLANKINEQPWLLDKNNLDWAWCINHYEEILNNKYADFKNLNNYQTNDNTNTFGQRKYSTEYLDSLYDDITQIEL